ncbi:hypothetical protein ES703_27517 [subsurface metagenome]
MPKLARAMGMSAGQIYRVRDGARGINQKFIIGATKAFPGYKLDDLFYIEGQPAWKEKARMTMASNEIGKTLKQQRLMIPLTLRELATRSGVSASHLARVERGQRFPSGHILRKIAKPLGLDESLLMTIAGYLLPQPPSETGEEHIYRGLDPYVARVLADEPVEVQRTVIGILTILKNIARGKE